jgi:hypothetical protein
VQKLSLVVSQLGTADRYDSPPGVRSMNATARSGWNAAVAAELATPAVLKLLPIDSNGALRDFTCVSASPRAAALLGSAIDDVAGHTLIEIMGSGHQTLELIRACDRVLATRRELLFVMDVATDGYAGRLLHQITPWQQGLTVTLTRPTAVGPNTRPAQPPSR